MIWLRYNPKDLRMIVVAHDGSKKSIYDRKSKRMVEKKEILLLEEHLNKTPSYMFLPSFQGIKKPTVFLHRKNINNETVFYCHSGLYREIELWCKQNNIEFKGLPDDFKYTGFNMPFNEFEEYVRSWRLSLEPREYQLKAAWLILHYRQSLSQMATRAGKTLIAYIVFRTLREKMGVKKILMVVPNISLVRQGVEDFKAYKEYFQSEEVWAKGEYCDSADLTIGTFQSLVRRCSQGKRGQKNKHYNPKWFDQFDAVLVDEAHTLTCDSINHILAQPFVRNAKIRFGFSGTLPDENTIESFCCHSLMGPTIQDITSKELMDEGYITPVKIHQVEVKHAVNDKLLDDYIKCGEYLCSNPSKDGEDIEKDFTIKEKRTLPIALREAKSRLNGWDYAMFLADLCKAKASNLLMLEQMLVHRSEKHIEAIEDIIRRTGSKDNNVIVFAHHVEYLKHLKQTLQERFKDKEVFLINSTTTVKKRREIIGYINSHNDCILVASFKCVGTGLTFKNINYGIFAQSFKSKTIVGQSLGRGLGLAPNKDVFELYDLIDHFPTEKIFMQGKARKKYYDKCEYDVLYEEF